MAESRQYIDIFRSKGVDVDICWNPGHADISGNEIVDKLAKAAVEEAEEMLDINTPATILDIQKAVKRF